MKFKVTYYKNAISVEREIEAEVFDPHFGRNGELVAVFKEGHIPIVLFAFSNVISVELISKK